MVFCGSSSRHDEWASWVIALWGSKAQAATAPSSRATAHNHLLRALEPIRLT